MDIIKLVYRYLNRFINGEELLKDLQDINTGNFSKKEKELYEKLIKKLQDTLDSIPNEVDEYEIKRLKELEKQMASVKEVIDSKSLKDEQLENFKKIYEDMQKSYNTHKDSEKRYKSIIDVCLNDELFKQFDDNMTDDELLKLIVGYFQVPCPPHLTQEKFDDLVNLAIQTDWREALFRLAFNYEKLNIDFGKIEDYYIEKRDAWFLTELVSAVGEDLNIDNLLRKVIATRDRDFMFDVKNHAKQINCFNEKEWDRLVKLANQIDSEYK